MADFETLIIGAGTAGARLATRLSQLSTLRGNPSIGLIEAGGSFQPICSRVPAWYPWCFGSAVDWAWQTEPQAELLNRRLRWPRGRLLGGSGAINALIDIQSSRADWNRWGWHWAENICTTDLPPHPESQASPHRWTEHFLSACQQSGLQLDERLGQSNKNICGTFMLSRRNGLRDHTGRGFNSLSGVELICDAVAREIVFHGTRAVGVNAQISSSNKEKCPQQITANRIVLCAGTLGSPELLLRSGVGPCDQLQDIGIACRVDLPGVGKNLQDHLVLPIVFRTWHPQGLPRIHGQRAREELRKHGAGSLTSNIAEATALLGDAGSNCADFQIHFTPNHYWKYPFRDDQRCFLSLNISDLHPRSRGELWLKPDSADRSRLQLAIDPGYLTDSSDLGRFARAYASSIRIAQQSSLAEIIHEPLTPELRDVAEVGKLLRTYAQSIYHPIGTCAMRSPLAGYSPVLNEQLQVLGTENLWIADASVLPDQPSCNPNRTVILIADRLAQTFGASV